MMSSFRNQPMHPSAILIALILVFHQSGFSQCSVSNQTFRSGEYGHYHVYYNWGFIWFNAAEVTFEAKPITIAGKKGYHFISSGSTYSNYDWIFKVRDIYQSKTDSATLTPIWFSRVTSEGGFQVNNQYHFKKNKIISSIENTNQTKKTDTLTYAGCVYDLLTAVYATRTISFQQIQQNDSVTIRVILDGKIYPLTIRYLGKETIVNKNEQEYKCQKIALELVAGTIFTGGQDMVIWVSDDEAKVPIRVEAKILVGSIVAHLTEVKGNIWPLSFRQIQKP